MTVGMTIWTEIGQIRWVVVMFDISSVDVVGFEDSLGVADIAVGFT